MSTNSFTYGDDIQPQIRITQSGRISMALTPGDFKPINTLDFAASLLTRTRDTLQGVYDSFEAAQSRRQTLALKPKRPDVTVPIIPVSDPLPTGNGTEATATGSASAAPAAVAPELVAEPDYITDDEKDELDALVSAELDAALASLKPFMDARIKQMETDQALADAKLAESNIRRSAEELVKSRQQVLDFELKLQNAREQEGLNLDYLKQAMKPKNGVVPALTA